MKRALTLALLVGACTGPAEAPPESARSWTRLWCALFLREGPDGKLYGGAELDPLLFPSSSYLLEEPRRSEVRAALTESLPVEGLTSLQRALWQRELWCVFDWSIEHEQTELAGRIAPLLKALALDTEQLRALPAPTKGVPSPTQGWVLVGDARGRPLAPIHVAHFDARSHVEVLLRLPEGRAATLAYFERLRASPAQPPQFPVGTSVALVRRLVLFDSRGELVLTPLVESVQLRTYRAIANPPSNSFDISKEQELAEFVLTRDGDLRALQAGEPDFSSFGTHGDDPFEEVRQREPWLHRTALQSCAFCHGQAGIYGFNSYTRMTSGPGTISDTLPGDEQLLPVEGDARAQLEATLAFRRDSDSWRALFPR